LNFSKEVEDVLVHLWHDNMESSVLYLNQFLQLFTPAMFRGAFVNLKSFIYRKKITNSLELRLLEYQQTVYLKGISDTSHEAKVYKAIVEHRESFR